MQLPWDVKNNGRKRWKESTTGIWHIWHFPGAGNPNVPSFVPSSHVWWVKFPVAHSENSTLDLDLETSFYLIRAPPALNSTEMWNVFSELVLHPVNCIPGEMSQIFQYFSCYSNRISVVGQAGWVSKQQAQVMDSLHISLGCKNKNSSYKIRI